MSTVKIVYFEHGADRPRELPASHPYRSGEAGAVWLDEDGFVETDVRVHLSSNSLHALIGHGVVDRLNDLRLELGPIGAQRDAVIAASAIESALRIFYEADRMTYGGVHDLLVSRSSRPEPVEYRIVIDNREYQRTLSKLQFLCSTASRMGHGVRIKL